MGAPDTKGRISLFNHDADDNGRIAPWVLSLALHVCAIIVLWSLRGASPVHPPEVMQVMIAQPNETPPFFSQLPADRKDTAPTKPDFLSNVTSRARDRVPGGDSNLPRMHGEGDAPTMKLAPERSASRSPSASPQQTTEPEGLRAAQSVIAPQKQNGESLLRLPDDQVLRGSAGNSDTDQPEMDHSAGNAALLGDVSLNTIAWDYAPWLQRFGMRLRERWFPPAAYLMGILKEGGWALIEVEISRSGKMLRLQLLDQKGHPSLSTAAQSALRAMAPIEPLPDDFPEQTLILRIRMTYPPRTP